MLKLLRILAILLLELRRKGNAIVGGAEHSERRAIRVDYNLESPMTSMEGWYRQSNAIALKY